MVTVNEKPDAVITKQPLSIKIFGEMLNKSGNETKVYDQCLIGVQTILTMEENSEVLGINTSDGRVLKDKGKLLPTYGIIQFKHFDNGISIDRTKSNLMNKLGTNARPRTKEFMEASAFDVQVWYNNPVLTEWLKEHANVSQLDNLKWMYYLINKCPWSCLDENEAFLTIADLTVKLLPKATKPITEWQGVQYRAAMLKPSASNFYPPDMDKMELELWTKSLNVNQQHDAMRSTCDLYSIPYSQEYHSFLISASDLLHKAGVEVCRIIGFFNRGSFEGMRNVMTRKEANNGGKNEEVRAKEHVEVNLFCTITTDFSHEDCESEMTIQFRREFIDLSLIEIKRDYEKLATNVVYGTVQKCFELKSRNEVMQYAKRTSLGSNQNGARQSMEGHPFFSFLQISRLVVLITEYLNISYCVLKS
ncbi:hypothetical protein GQ457_04G006440 [Hibiscus cannabinus]